MKCLFYWPWTVNWTIFFFVKRDRYPPLPPSTNCWWLVSRLPIPRSTSSSWILFTMAFLSPLWLPPCTRFVRTFCLMLLQSSQKDSSTSDSQPVFFVPSVYTANLWNVFTWCHWKMLSWFIELNIRIWYVRPIDTVHLTHSQVQKLFILPTS